MNKHTLTASTLSATVGLALAMLAMPGQAADMNNMSKMQQEIVQKTMTRMKTNHLEKCYGINAVAKNDCAAGAHSCSGQATSARDPASFVLVPAGDCGKIEGGKLTS